MKVLPAILLFLCLFTFTITSRHVHRRLMFLSSSFFSSFHPSSGYQADKESHSPSNGDKVESKKAAGRFFRSSSGGVTRQLSGRLQQQQKTAKLRSADSPVHDDDDEDESKRDETIVFISLVVILVSITLILLTSVVYIARRHQLLRRKILHLLGRLDMSEPADDYKVM